MMEEGKIHIQTLALLHGPVTDVLHYYFESKELNSIKLEEFLNLTHNKHKLFHEFIPRNECCECFKYSMAKKDKRGTMLQWQHLALYDDSGKGLHSHGKKNGKMQYCLCKYSAKGGITVDELDITLLYLILHRCGSSTRCKPWLEDIKNIRNCIVHANDGTISKSEYETKWAKLKTATLEFAGLIGESIVKKFQRKIESLKSKPIEDLKDTVQDAINKMTEISSDLNGMTNLKTKIDAIFEAVSSQQKHVEQLQDVKSEQKKQGEQLASQGQDIKDVKLVLEQMYGKYGNVQTLSDIKRHNSDRTDDKKGESEKVEGQPTIHDVVVTIKTPSTWDKEKIQSKLSERLNKDDMGNEDELHLVDFKFKCLILTTKASSKLINNRMALMTAIGSFLKGIFDDCEIDTSIPETVHIIIDVYCPLPVDYYEKHLNNTSKNWQLEQTVPENVDEFTDIKPGHNQPAKEEQVKTEQLETMSTKIHDDSAGKMKGKVLLAKSDNVVICQHCGVKFPCEKCKARIDWISTLEKANAMKEKTIKTFGAGYKYLEETSTKVFNKDAELQRKGVKKNILKEEYDSISKGYRQTRAYVEIDPYPIDHVGRSGEEDESFCFSGEEDESSCFSGEEDESSCFSGEEDDLGANIFGDVGAKVAVARHLSVPLKESTIHVTIQGYIANVDSTLVYINETNDVVETKFIFPMDDMSAVYKLEADLNGRHIVGECQDKEKAEKTYKEAFSTGHTAIKLVENSGDIFECKLGNLEAGQIATVRMAYVIELTKEPDEAFTFEIPRVLIPRYSPCNKTGDMEKVHLSESKLPEKMTFTADVKGNYRINSIVSTIPDLTIDISNDQFSAKISLQESYKIDNNVSFSISYSDIKKTEAILEVGDTNKDGLLKNDILMLTLYPDLKNQKKDVKREFIFVIDRSGSMRGRKIKNAKETLTLFLKSLPLGCLFNVVSFGSRYMCLFEQSQEYSEETVTKAIEYQNEIKADMGGTEILRPLRAIYSQKCTPGYPRQIFLLTHGAVSNTSEIVAIVRQNADNSRVFTFGMGDGASTSLIRNVAKAGKGRATFIQDKDENIKAQVITALQYSMEDCMSDIELDCNLSESYTVATIPRQPPNLFDGDHFTIFYVINSTKTVERLSGQIKVTGVIAGETITLTIDLQESTFATMEQPIHRLVAKYLIKELESEESEYWRNGTYKDKITVASQSANVISKYTSFVGVDAVTRIPVWKRMRPSINKASTYKDNLFTEKSEEVQIFIKTLKGKTIIVQIALDSTIEEMKDAIYEKENIPVGQQRLIWSGKHLTDGPTLQDYGISRESTVLLLEPLAGGGLPRSVEGWLKFGESKFGDIMMRLVELQKFDGSWEFSTDLVKYLGVNEKILRNCKRYQMNVWCTAFVVAFLQQLFADRYDEWKMVELKSLTWLETHAGKSLKELLSEVKDIKLDIKY